ncbi:transposase [Kitasatospora sp. NPDC127067]|uniref:transposase n=1 Tax=Kitasatospora sp. NPDC127067 TaxID=3347126 RepID=UPI003666F6C9
MTRVQLTDSEWEFIEPHLPIGAYGPYPERLRQQFEGVIWHFKTGSQWREMPGEFGAWSTVHNRFRQFGEFGEGGRSRRVDETILLLEGPEEHRAIGSATS